MARMLLLATFSCFIFKVRLDSSSSVILSVSKAIFCPTSDMKSFNVPSQTHLSILLLKSCLFLLQLSSLGSYMDLFESCCESSNISAPLKLMISVLLMLLKLSSLKVQELLCSLESLGLTWNSEVCLNFGIWQGLRVCFSTDLLGQFLSILPWVSSFFLFSKRLFIFSISSSSFSILYSLFDLFPLLGRSIMVWSDRFSSGSSAKLSKYCLKQDRSFCVLGISLTVPMETWLASVSSQLVLAILQLEMAPVNSLRLSLRSSIRLSRFQMFIYQFITDNFHHFCMEDYRPVYGGFPWIFVWGSN